MRISFLASDALQMKKVGKNRHRCLLTEYRNVLKKISMQRAFWNYQIQEPELFAATIVLYKSIREKAICVMRQCMHYLRMTLRQATLYSTSRQPKSLRNMRSGGFREINNKMMRRKGIILRTDAVVLFRYHRPLLPVLYYNSGRNKIDNLRNYMHEIVLSFSKQACPQNGALSAAYIDYLL